MKRFLPSAARAALGLAAVCCGSAATSARADSYLFERSYYSHAPAKPVVVGHRAPTGGPQFTRPQGYAVISSFRQQQAQIRIGGQLVDQTIYREGWVQFQEKH